MSKILLPQKPALAVPTIDWTQFDKVKANCFVKNGEEFIVLPHLLQSSFHEFTSAQIEQACEKLHIKLLLCETNELQVLKACGILPQDCKRRVGLIRRSDAERLFKTLALKEITAIRQSGSNVSDEDYIPVEHNCFGNQNGRFYVQRYVHPNSACIQCGTCEAIFSPSEFVGHSHSLAEVRGVVHWGFDAANWRLYLGVTEEGGGGDNSHMALGFGACSLEEWNHLLDQCKSKFFAMEHSQEQSPRRSRMLDVWSPAVVSTSTSPSSSPSSFHSFALPEPPAIMTKFTQPTSLPVHLKRHSLEFVAYSSSSSCHLNDRNNPDVVPNIALKPVTKDIKPNLKEDDWQMRLSAESKVCNETDLPTSGADTPFSYFKKSSEKPLLARTATRDVSHTQRTCTNTQLALVKAIFALDQPQTSRELLRLFEDVKRAHQLVVSSMQEETRVLKRKLARRQEDHLQQQKRQKVNIQQVQDLEVDLLSLNKFAHKSLQAPQGCGPEKVAANEEAPLAS